MMSQGQNGSDPKPSEMDFLKAITLQMFQGKCRLLPILVGAHGGLYLRSIHYALATYKW